MAQPTSATVLKLLLGGRACVVAARRHAPCHLHLACMPPRRPGRPWSRHTPPDLSLCLSPAASPLPSALSHGRPNEPECAAAKHRAHCRPLAPWTCSLVQPRCCKAPRRNRCPRMPGIAAFELFTIASARWPSSSIRRQPSVPELVDDSVRCAVSPRFFPLFFRCRSRTLAPRPC